MRPGVFEPLTLRERAQEWSPRLTPLPQPAATSEEAAMVGELRAASRAAESRRAAEHHAALQQVSEREQALEEATERMQAIVTRLEEERTSLFREARAGIAAVILAAARRIAGDALRADHALLDALVDEGIRALGDEGMTLRVAPADEERVVERLGIRNILVVADPAIDGGCVCEGPAGSIDATRAIAEQAVASVLDRWAER